MSSHADKAAADNRANQLNPNSAAYSSSRGGGPVPSATAHMDKAGADNYSNQLNPNNAAYQSSRGGGGAGGGRR